jgi:disease resistance protein RPM1
MKSLNDQDSRRLFLSRVFGLGEPCPGELEKVSTDILKKCGGVPLAVISISSLLADKPKQTFEFVMNYLGSMFEGNPTLEQMRQILELSYRNLPSHLKTCLLYLGMYPEDNIINRDDLLRQWIAEGFVCTTPRQDAEDVAISYFNELINRSMIQPVRTEYNCEVLSCRLHDIMLDVIRSKIEEDNFIAILNDPKVLLAVHRNIRRVSLQCHGEECRVTPAMVNGALSKVRSVVVFGGFSCPSTMVLKSVRVLHLDIDGNKVLDLTWMSGLSELRYFKVFCSSTGVMLKLPSHIGKLRQLETFDLRASVLKLPSDIASLPRLSHLIVFPNTVFPDGICRLRSLRSVWTFNLHRNSVQNVEGRQPQDPLDASCWW